MRPLHKVVHNTDDALVHAGASVREEGMWHGPSQGKRRGAIRD
jgi:hypothetical protein